MKTWYKQQTSSNQVLVLRATNQHAEWVSQHQPEPPVHQLIIPLSVCQRLYEIKVPNGASPKHKVSSSWLTAQKQELYALCPGLIDGYGLYWSGLFMQETCKHDDISFCSRMLTSCTDMTSWGRSSICRVTTLPDGGRDSISAKMFVKCSLTKQKRVFKILLPQLVFL